MKKIKFQTESQKQESSPNTLCNAIKGKSNGNDNSNYDDILVIKSLSILGKGSTILFFGTIIGLILNFLARIVITRFYTPEDYGLYNLFYTVLSIFLTFGLLGLRTGISRFIGYYTGSGEKEKIKGVETWGLIIGFVNGIFFGIILFLMAPQIAILFTSSPEYVHYLRIAAFTLPFYALLSSVISIFRGHQRAQEKIIFYDLGRNGIFLLLILTLGFFAIPFVGVIYSMFFATVITSISIFIYYIQKQKGLIKTIESFSFSPSIAKEVLLFSTPLMFVGIMYNLMAWTDTMLIGFFLPDSMVGYYNVAKPLSIFITNALIIVTFIYSPVVAALYAQKKFKENDVIFTTLTKWICLISLPLAMTFFFFSESVILFLFDSEYSPAAIPLKILCIGYFFEALNGPNGPTLTAYNRTKFLMFATGLAAGMNILFNVLLIPIYGIIGAAYATSFTLVFVNIIRTYKLYSISGVHSFKPDVLKPVILTISTGIFIAIGLTKLPIPGVSQAIIAFIFLSIIFLIMMLLTKSVSSQDIKLLNMIENKFNLNLSYIRRLLKRFV